MNKLEYSFNILGFFFFDIFEIKLFIIEFKSITYSSNAVIISSIKLSFNFISVIFS